MVAGFVLCGANIVGNIISAEKRCNYPGRSRVTRLVSICISVFEMLYVARCFVYVSRGIEIWSHVCAMTDHCIGCVFT